MGDDHTLRDALAGPQGLDVVRLLVQRVAVIARLLRGAETKEVRKQEGMALSQRRDALPPVVG